MLTWNHLWGAALAPQMWFQIQAMGLFLVYHFRQNDWNVYNYGRSLKGKPIQIFHLVCILRAIVKTQFRKWHQYNAVSSFGTIRHLIDIIEQQCLGLSLPIQTITLNQANTSQWALEFNDNIMRSESPISQCGGSCDCLQLYGKTSMNIWPESFFPEIIF